MSNEIIFLVDAIQSINARHGVIEGKALDGLCKLLDRLVEDECKGVTNA